MAEYAVYFNRYFAMKVEAESSEQAIERALEQFVEDEANAASDWEVGDVVDRLS